MTAKPKAGTAKPKPDTAIPSPLHILKVGTCPSLSGASTLTYHIGSHADTGLHFRVWDNTGGGLFGREWVAWTVIEPALQAEKLTGGTLRPLFRGKSRNTPGFLLAVLKAEGLVEPLGEQGYRKADSKGFLAAMEALITSAVDIPDPEKKPSIPVKPTTKPAGKAAG